MEAERKTAGTVKQNPTSKVKQEPINNEQKSTTKVKQEPINNEQKSTTQVKQEPINNEQKSTTKVKQEPINNEQKPTTKVKQEPTTKVKQEPTTKVKQEPINNEQKPTTKVKQEPTTNEQKKPGTFVKPSPSPPEAKWYAIYTRPRAEKQVAERLEEKDIHVYLPLQKKLKQWSDRKKWVEIPLFSSYLFVKIDRRDYDRVLHTNGVVKYITFEGKAVPIPQNQIDNLRIVVDSNAEVETTWESRRKGEKVRVNGGPLKGLEGVLISDGGRKKVLVQVDRLDQNLVVEVPLGLIEKI